jgi:hypothetical protein
VKKAYIQPEMDLLKVSSSGDFLELSNGVGDNVLNGENDNEHVDKDPWA